MAKEVRPGISRVTLDMPNELFERLRAYATADADPYSKATLANACRKLLHEGLERAGFPAKPKAKGKSRS